AQIAHDARDLLSRAAGEEGARGLREVAWPDQVIATQIVVALAAAPRDGKACDQATGKSGAFVAAQHRGADAIHVVAGHLAVERAKLRLPGTPVHRILFQLPVIWRLQAGADAEASLGRGAAEA